MRTRARRIGRRGATAAALLAGASAFAAPGARAEEEGSGLAALWPEGLELTAEIAFEPRFFPEDPAFAGQLDGFQASGFIKPELSWENDARDLQIAVTPFFRLDARDDERTHFDIREAYVRRFMGDWDVLFGANQVFWGVTESRHLVNIVNQIDAVEDIDEEDFLGQPMLQIGRQTDFGRFELFLMSGFRERTFAGPPGRLRPPLFVDDDDARFESGLENARPEVALRYTHVLGDVDLGLHVFHGTSREPNLEVAADLSALTPFYPVITQGGVDLQYTTGPWLWKLEGLARAGQDDGVFGAAVAGVEYTFFQAFGTDADLGLLAEGLYDGRSDGVTLALGAAPPTEPIVFTTTFDRDVFLGARLGLNDVQDTAVLAGLVIDTADGPASVRIEAERRIGQNWKAVAEGTVFLEDDPGNPASVFEQDSFLQIRLSRFF